MNERTPLLSESKPQPKYYLPARYVLVIMVHLGFAVVFSLRVSFNVTILSMMTSTSNSSGPSDVQAPTYPWTHSEEETLLSLLFFGYLFNQVTGGMLSAKYGAKIVLGVAGLLTSVLAMTVPIAASMGVVALGTVRFLMGLVQAVMFPSMYSMLGVWTLSKDRTVLTSFACAGNYLGTAVTMPLSGAIASRTFPWGWPMVFYLTGLIGLVWTFFWLLLIHDSPCSHPRISDHELDLFKIQHDKQHHHRSPSLSEIPWSAIFLSGPVFASTTAMFCVTWSFLTILTNLPTYFQNVFHVEISKNGFQSALPYIVSGLVQVVSGWCADTLLRRRAVNRTLLRKIYTLIGFLGSAFCLMAAGYINTNHHELTILLFVMALSLHVFNNSGFNLSIVEMAPNFSGAVMSIVNTVGSVPGCIAPLVIAEFTKKQSTQAEWRKVFYLSAGLNVFGALIFTIMGSSKEQPWNVVVDRRKPIISAPPSD